MAVWDLYSKRRKRELGQVPEVFTYDRIPSKLRTQIVQIWAEAIGTPYYDKHDGTTKIQGTYQEIVQILRREYGVFKLSDHGNPHDQRDAHSDLTIWFLSENHDERVLDAIELTFRIIDIYCSGKGYIHGRNNRQIASDAVSELNIRFKEHGIGYQFTDSQIIRVDSQLIHAEAVIPALTLLRDKKYAGAQEEFLSAYEHYRHGRKEGRSACGCLQVIRKHDEIDLRQAWVDIRQEQGNGD